MAGNLLAAGYPLTVYNRSASRAETLIAKGADLATSLPLLAQECDAVISMISDDEALKSISYGVDGLFAGAAKPGLIFVDMSTVSPRISGQIAATAHERGIHYLRAPVSGSIKTAEDAALTILVSGPKDYYEHCAPLFETLGKKLYYVGPEEQARYLKLAINMMIGITAAMIGEALVLGEQGGIEWAQMIEVFANSAAASPLLGYKVQMLKNRAFDPMFTASQMAKDFDLALDTGREHSAPMPITALSRQFLGAMIASGRGELDFFAYVTLLEELAGLKH